MIEDATSKSYQEMIKDFEEMLVIIKDELKKDDLLQKRD